MKFENDLASDNSALRNTLSDVQIAELKRDFMLNILSETGSTSKRNDTQPVKREDWTAKLRSKNSTRMSSHTHHSPSVTDETQRVFSVIDRKPFKQSLFDLGFWMSDFKNALVKAALKKEAFIESIRGIYGTVNERVIDQFRMSILENQWDGIIPWFDVVKAADANHYCAQVGGLYSPRFKRIFITDAVLNASDQYVREQVVLELIGFHVFYLLSVDSSKAVDVKSTKPKHRTGCEGVNFRNLFARSQGGYLRLESGLASKSIHLSSNISSNSKGLEEVVIHKPRSDQRIVCGVEVSLSQSK